jgi:hypothetical protein
VESHALTASVKALFVVDNKGEMCSLATLRHLSAIIQNAPTAGSSAGSGWDAVQRMYASTDAASRRARIAVEHWQRYHKEVDVRLWSVGSARAALCLSLNPFPLTRFGVLIAAEHSKVINAPSHKPLPLPDSR